MFSVSCDDSDAVYVCHAPKKLRHSNNEIFVGDKVCFTPLGRNGGVIDGISPRKNQLVRPEVSNVDCVFVVTAPIPLTDLILVDKILVNCFQRNISAVLVVNKVESCSQHFIDKIKSNYSGVVDIAFVSAHNGSRLQNLVDRIGGQTVCLAGQSGVGKSSLLNALAPESLATTQGLSVKIERGKNTTRKTQLYKLNGGFIVDTPGFSLLDIDVNSADLQLYYPDFCQYMDKCKYHMCTHTAEPDCAVKDALNHGLLNAERYSRYVKIREELLLKEKTQF